MKMRTMAVVWFLVVVLVTINGVFGNICSSDQAISNCDDCMRCGYNWCNQNAHCAFIKEDDWCPVGNELLPKNNADHEDGIYAMQTLAIDSPSELVIEYNAQNPNKPIVHIINTTQTNNIEIKVIDEKSTCVGTKCIAQIEATATQNFCNTWGRVHEFVYAQIYVGNYSDVFVVKYHVPCACECSLNVTKNSPVCNGHGDYACGRCECRPEWKGDKCDKPNCPEKRGDVQCMHRSRMDVDCFGNGYCGECDTCVCYPDREGSQYFDADDYCSDLCILTSNCDLCLYNSSIGYCSGCVDSSMKIIPMNRTAENDRDLKNRKVWMRCNITVLDCSINYLAMRDEEDEISVMIVNSCNDMEAGAVGAASKVPVILGALAAVAIILAAAAAVIYKHLNALPPLPLNDSQYQNINGQGYQCQNPIYRPPMTSFKNPMYGKP